MSGPVIQVSGITVASIGKKQESCWQHGTNGSKLRLDTWYRAMALYPERRSYCPLRRQEYV